MIAFLLVPAEINTLEPICLTLTDVRVEQCSSPDLSVISKATFLKKVQSHINH